MAATLLNQPDRADLTRRLSQLRPDAQAQWGQLDAPRMLCHLADQLRVALGDLPSRSISSFLRRTLAKFLVVHTSFQPPKGKVQTAPEMLSTAPTTWEADVKTLIALIERVGAGQAHSPHPAFGPLTAAEWGKLGWKHCDYHFRQFGI